MNLREVYEPVSNMMQKAAATKLRPYEWEVLGQVDGKRTAAEIGVNLSLSESVLDWTFTRLLDKGLVQLTELTWEEFLARYSEVTPEPLTDALVEPPPLPVEPPPPAFPMGANAAPTASFPTSSSLPKDGDSVEFTIGRIET